jgi:hypothetical protein
MLMTRKYAQLRRGAIFGHHRRSGFLSFVALMSLGGCNGAPSRNILGSYFPSWMVCAIVGIAAAGISRPIFKSMGILQELPAPFVVFFAIGCATTFALWLLWLA